jgi:hypothetical protein
MTSTKPEQRRAARKPLESTGVLTLGGIPFNIKTVDVSSGGLSFLVNKQLPVGRDCHVNFDVPVAGQAHIVAVSAHVVYCFFRGEEGYKIGLEFLQVHADGSEVIGRYVGSQP